MNYCHNSLLRIPQKTVAIVIVRRCLIYVFTEHVTQINYFARDPTRINVEAGQTRITRTKRDLDDPTRLQRWCDLTDTK